MQKKKKYVTLVPTYLMKNNPSTTPSHLILFILWRHSQRKRNRENMRKFRQPKAIGRDKKPKSSVAFKRAVAKQAESDFTAKMFSFIKEEVSTDAAKESA